MTCTTYDKQIGEKKNKINKHYINNKSPIITQSV